MTALALTPSDRSAAAEPASSTNSRCVCSEAPPPRSIDLLAALVQTSPRPVAVKDTRRHYVAVNLAYAELLGRSPDSLIGCRDEDVLAPAAALQSRRRDESVLSDGGAVSGIMDLQGLAGPARPQSGTVLALRDQGRVVGLACWLEASDEGLVGDQRLMAHLAAVTHELRSPLTGVIGLARLSLGEADLPPRQRPWLEAIAHCGEHLIDTVNDLVDVGMLLSGQVSLRPQPVRLDQLLAELIEWVRPLPGGSALELRAELQVPLGQRGEPVVLVDGRRLRQLLLNLLSNAVRATRSGQVVVQAAPVPRPGLGAVSGRWRFEVRDTGSGLDPQRLSALQRQERAQPQPEGEVSSRSGGIGLLISRGLAHAMGGALQVSSTLGVGTNFSFEIDAPSTKALPARHGDPA